MASPTVGRLAPRGTLIGPDAVRATQAIKLQNDEVNKWPFPWSYAPRNSKKVFQQGAIVAPAQNIQAQILQYEVPDSMYFVLQAIVLYFQGTSGVAPGSFTFTLDVNSPIGITNAQATPFSSFGNVITTLGDLTQQWPIYPGETDILRPKDVLRAKVTNAAITPGDPNYFIAMFMGYTMPQRGNR